MKLINTYKQYNITWFNYKHLFQWADDYIYAHKASPESELLTWVVNPHLNVSIRKPYEAD